MSDITSYLTLTGTPELPNLPEIGIAPEIQEDEDTLKRKTGELETLNSLQKVQLDRQDKAIWAARNCGAKAVVMERKISDLQCQIKDLEKELKPWRAMGLNPGPLGENNRWLVRTKSEADERAKVLTEELSRMTAERDQFKDKLVRAKVLTEELCRMTAERDQVMTEEEKRHTKLLNDITAQTMMAQVMDDMVHRKLTVDNNELKRQLSSSVQAQRLQSLFNSERVQDFKRQIAWLKEDIANTDKTWMEFTDDMSGVTFGICPDLHLHAPRSSTVGLFPECAVLMKEGDDIQVRIRDSETGVIYWRPARLSRVNDTGERVHAVLTGTGEILRVPIDRIRYTDNKEEEQLMTTRVAKELRTARSKKRRKKI